MNRALILKILVSTAVLGYLAGTQDFPGAFALLAKTDLRLFVLGLAIAWVVQMIGAWRWQLLAAPLGIVLNIGHSFRYFLMGNFFSMFLPGTVGGDVGRMVLIGRHCEKPKLLVALTLVMEKLFGLAGLLVLTLGALLSPDVSGLAQSMREVFLWTGGIALVVIMALGLLPIEKVTRRFWGVDVFTDKLPVYRNTRLVAVSLLLACLTHLMLILVHGLIAQALGLPITWVDLVWVYGIVSMAVIVPLSFNGIGIREGGYVLLLASTGVSSEGAVSFALYWFFVLLSVNMLSGLALFQARRGLSPARSMPIDGK